MYLLSLAMVVFFASIMVFFSQEFIRTFKRIFAIKGAKTIIPLAIASWAIYTFDYWFLWVIYYCREFLQASLTLLTHIMPFQKEAESVALILLLMFVSVVPVYLLDWFLRFRTYKPYKYNYLTSTIILITSSILLLAI